MCYEDNAVCVYFYTTQWPAFKCDTNVACVPTDQILR